MAYDDGNIDDVDDGAHVARKYHKRSTRRHGARLRGQTQRTAQERKNLRKFHIAQSPNRFVKISPLEQSNGHLYKVKHQPGAVQIEKLRGSSRIVGVFDRFEPDAERHANNRHRIHDAWRAKFQRIRSRILLQSCSQQQCVDQKLLRTVRTASNIDGKQRDGRV